MNPTYYEQSITVKESDFDLLHHVNNVIYLQWVQDLAEAHWKHKTKDELLERYLWVAVRHEIDYKKEITKGESIFGRTWVESMEGVRSIRHCEIYGTDKNENLQLKAKARTVWCLLDAKTKKPKRIPDTLKTIFL